MVDFPLKDNSENVKKNPQENEEDRFDKKNPEATSALEVTEIHHDELFQKYLSPEEIEHLKNTSEFQNEKEFIETEPQSLNAQDLPEFKPKKKFSFLTSLIIGLLGIGLIFGGFSVWSFYQNQNGNSSTADKFNLLNVLPGAVKAATNNYVKLKGQDEGRTNFVVYGLTQDEMRTDTIMLVSYYHKEKKFVTLNIPRDLYQNDGFQSEKLVSVYTFAKLRQPNNPNYPAEFTTQFLEKEYGIPIHYWSVVNMQAFKDIIDQIGGVEINVENSFTDYFYPTDNYSGYIRPAPSFKKGVQQMNGTTALIFARSRKSEDNGEGSDFARGKRQAMVIQAATSKIKSKGVLENVVEINNYLGIVSKYVSTNMTTDEMLSVANFAKNLTPAIDILIANWSYETGFICDGKSAIGQDILLYGIIGDCKTRMGGGQDSIYRQKAISYVQNLYKTVQFETFLKTPVVVLGNQSNDTDKAEKALSLAGFMDVDLNNSYKSIKEATSTSTESTTVYISNPDLKKSFQEVTSSYSFKYNIEDKIPSNLILPKGFDANTQILVWVASI